MGSKYVDELLVSLKELYKTSAYSDLVLECGDDEHKVHRAVVCPRSKRLAEMLSKETDSLVLADDDPQAVSLMLHYLYHLDYPDVQAHEQREEIETVQATPTSQPTSSSHADKNPNGIVNGSNNTAAKGQAPRTLEYSIEKEQFIDPATVPGTGDASSEAGLKKGKKKKRRNTPIEHTDTVAPNGAATQTQVQVQSSPQQGQTQEAAPLSSSPSIPTTTSTTKATAPTKAATTASTITPTPTSTPIPITTAPTLISPSSTATETTQHQHPSLTVHAQLYALARKYGVAGLAALAAAKFEQGVGRHWATGDFLRAAREAYTSTDRGDRRLRDAVLAAVQAHPELLGRSAVQEAIRGLELSFDLLMHMRGDTSGVPAAATTSGLNKIVTA